MLISPTCSMLCLEHEIAKLKQDLDVEKRRSLGFEQDLENIIGQVSVYPSSLIDHKVPS